VDYSEDAKKNMILKVRVGSHLFGTNTPDSDLDYEGIFMPPISVVFGIDECKEVDLGTVSKNEKGRNTKDAIDFKIREYRTFIRLALQNNPNILNILFCNDENVIYQDEYGKALRDFAVMFPHRNGLKRFLGYGISQRKKMTIKPRNHEIIVDAIGFLELCDKNDVLVNISRNSSLFIDEGPGKHIKVADLNFERGLRVSKALARLKDRLNRVSSRSYNWIKNGYDSKFASNLILILLSGIELGKSGRIQFPLKDRDLILDIKKDVFSLNEVEEMANSLILKLSSLIEGGKCEVPSKPLYKTINNFTIEQVRSWMDCHGTQ